MVIRLTKSNLSDELGNFEIKNKDLLGRIGDLTTKSGKIETPYLFPVINPTTQLLSVDEISKELGCNAIMTNAYLLKKKIGDIHPKRKVHDLLKFEGVIFTDSGAYQMLTYGSVEVEPLEIIKFEEDIGSDLAVILDIPTGVGKGRKKAEWSVNETLKRADESLENIKRKDILWVGPIQGGTFLDLVEYCAKEMSKKPFDLYALGSPTKVMESYDFETLFEMIFKAKKHLPVEKPFHLFGAGHPFMFSMAVAAGCDSFDSASYAIYARNGRYLTTSGTIRLDNLKYFPCFCPVCIKFTPKELRELPENERIKLLSKHNLYACLEEINRIKEAIFEGRLWELIEIRAKSHPRLFEALMSFKNYKEMIENSSPSTKRLGIFYFGRQSSLRPEVVSYRRKIIETYQPPSNSKSILLMPSPEDKPYHRNKFMKSFTDNLESNLHICFYTIPYGIVPIEIDDMFPLSQTETVKTYDSKTIDEIIEIITDYLKTNNYEELILHADESIFTKIRLDKIKKICDVKNIEFKLSYLGKKVWDQESLDKLKRMLGFSKGASSK
jgi:7-cyano-7-deazaguanine tRNA-ribosyltransferase